MVSQDPHTILDKFMAGIELLSLESSDDEFEKAVSYLAPNCTVYRMGNPIPVSSDRAGYIADVKKLLGYWAILEQRVTLRATSIDGKTVVHEMDNDLKIYGAIFPHFREILMAEFDEAGLISCIRVYCDPSLFSELASKHTSGQ